MDQERIKTAVLDDRPNRWRVIVPKPVAVGAGGTVGQKDIRVPKGQVAIPGKGHAESDPLFRRRWTVGEVDGYLQLRPLRQSAIQRRVVLNGMRREYAQLHLSSK